MSKKARLWARSMGTEGGAWRSLQWLGTIKDLFPDKVTTRGLRNTSAISSHRLFLLLSASHMDADFIKGIWGGNCVMVFFFFSIFCSQNCKNIPTNHSLWSACFTWTRLWEGYQQLWFLSSELCTKLLLNSYVLLSGFPFKISYFYHPVALNMFCGIQMVLGSGSCDFISCNNFVTLLCILCCLFKFWILS